MFAMMLMFLSLCTIHPREKRKRDKPKGKVCLFQKNGLHKLLLLKLVSMCSLISLPLDIHVSSAMSCQPHFITRKDACPRRMLPLSLPLPHTDRSKLICSVASSLFITHRSSQPLRLSSVFLI